ncbi:SNARE associated Golgi protein [Bremerella volcania]|uniref:TVP38/TMEM64 family membrane protein n=1 Tax=Bremerella volcania TaxID=2527984 RepID=A0A518CDS1_9BACT|nr:VTT domain-containing protein [Bremerella volcania]QDU77344.1 SNARE associated Golgi protein [Bremerella volcania]
MRTFLKILILFAVVLAIPIVPFVIWGHWLEQAARAWEETQPRPMVMAIVLFGLLALDVLLPVPSSLVNTLAGAKLGVFTGATVCFAGLTVGAAIGFGLAKLAGPPLQRRWLADADAQSLKKFAENWGVVTLVITRALPILAEAAVVLLGVQGLSWRKFWPPVLLANAGIALAYSAFGNLAAQQEWLVVALAISAGLPLLLTFLVRRWLQTAEKKEIA